MLSTLQRKTPMRRSNPDRAKGLGHKVEVFMGFYRPPGHKMPSLLRSEAHLENIRELPCALCGSNVRSQAAHANITKGAAIKACDSLAFPLCPTHHRMHDQGGMPRDERRRREWEYADATRATLMQRGQWGPEIELHYQKAVEPLRRLVKGDEEKEKAAVTSGLGTTLTEKL